MMEMIVAIGEILLQCLWAIFLFVFFVAFCVAVLQPRRGGYQPRGGDKPPPPPPPPPKE